MRHLFVIQCHQYLPAKNLGELIKSLSKEFEVVYAYDERSPEYLKLKSLPNSMGFIIGYFSIDQGLYHLLLWNALSKNPKFNNFDFYHVISESDLPFNGIFRINSLTSGIDAYGFTHQIRLRKSILYKGVTWYGISNKVVKFLGNSYSELVFSAIKEVWFNYTLNNHIHSGFTGSFDEYFIGWLLKLIKDKYNDTFLDDCLRFVLYPESDRLHVEGYEGDVSWYGKLSENVSSPVILDDTPAVNYAFENWNVLFGRKFQFDSESYAHFVKLIKDAKI